MFAGAALLVAALAVAGCSPARQQGNDAAARAQRRGRAEQHVLTLYEAAYAAVARARGAELVTLDRALLRSRLGRRPSSVLADLPLSS